MFDCPMSLAVLSASFALIFATTRTEKRTSVFIFFRSSIKSGSPQKGLRFDNVIRKKMNAAALINVPQEEIFAVKFCPSPPNTHVT